MTTALFLLRAFELGLHVEDLDSLEYGMVLDMMTEASNDSCEYTQIATQEDFDRF